MSRPIVIGGGPNGLVAACYLARAGLRPIVLERLERVGGSATTGEVAPGFRVPTLSHGLSIDPAIVTDLALEAHGVHFIEPGPAVFLPAPDGPGVVLARDPREAGRAIETVSSRDAARFVELAGFLDRVGPAIAAIARRAPPALDDLEARDLWSLLGHGSRLRRLGTRDLHRLLRYGPMPVADFAEEWFETPALRGLMAARGVFGGSDGPRAAGSTLPLLMQAAFDRHPAGAVRVAAGGTGRLAEALASAARAAGAEIRTGCDVVGIEVSDAGAVGVALSGGTVVEGAPVLSSADPRRTFLGLIEPERLDPAFREHIRHYRSDGTVAKVNLALSAPPRFASLRSLDEASALQALAGRIVIAPDVEYVERAHRASKYGCLSDRPWLELTIPSIADASLAPPGRHVASIYAQFAPRRLREGEWDSQREALRDRVMAVLEEYAPGIAGLVAACEVITPLDLERTYGLTGGHIFHGEHAADQLWAFRPSSECGRYRTPLPGLYLCGAGAHPGGGLTGLPGKLAAGIVLQDVRTPRTIA